MKQPDLSKADHVTMDKKTDSPAAAQDVLRVEAITKSFGPVKVLRGVDLHLAPGEVLGVVGSNGAGKSTLVKIITGYDSPDAGQLYVEGRPVNLHSVQDARAHGIETVFQDLALVDELSVFQNLFLNREITSAGRFRFLNNRRMREDAMRYLEEIQVNIPSVDVPVEKLSGGQRQAIAVARATRREDVKILLLDEPLAAMGAKEAKTIIDLVKSLARTRGVSMVVIDHNYTHIFELCDRVNVVEQGRITLDKRTADTSLAELTEFMVSSYRQQVEGKSA